MQKSITLLATLVWILIGCQPGSISDTAVFNDLHITIWSSTACAQAGEKVHLRASISNNGNSKEVFDVNGKPILDILVLDNGKTTRWSDEKPLTPSLTHLELMPGESKTIEMEWISAPIASGNGHADAIFTHGDQSSSYQRASIPINVAPCPGLGP